MKKTASYIICTAILTTLTILSASCRRTSHNGKIDGFWRIDRIEFFQSGEPEQTVIPQDLFYAINLELMQLCQSATQPPYSNYPTITGVISYHKGDDRLGVEFPNKPDIARLKVFGIPSNPVTFRIETLTGRSLVLATETSRITCSRF